LLVGFAFYCVAIPTTEQSETLTLLLLPLLYIY